MPLPTEVRAPRAWPGTGLRALAPARHGTVTVRQRPWRNFAKVLIYRLGLVIYGEAGAVAAAADAEWHPQADWLTTRAMKAADPPPPPPPPPPAPRVTVASYQSQHADAQTPDPPDQQQGNGDDARASGDGSYGHPNYCGDGDGDGWDVPCQDHSSSQDGDNPSTSNGDNAPVTASGGTPQSSSGGGGGGGGRGGQIVSPSSYSGFQACVIARESGGNSQIMNSPRPLRPVPVRCLDLGSLRR